MQQFNATVTWTTPSYAWYLGETATKLGLDPKKDLTVKKIFVAGEPGGSVQETRERIEELWGADVYDYYGLSDIFGSCAGMCEEKDGLHWAEDHIIIEVLDELGNEVAEGQRGEMVLTSIKKDARPLIRFRTGDIVSYTTERCRCGRTSLRLHGIHGRVDDMLIIKGVNVFPSDIEAITRKNTNLTGEYQLIVDRVNHLDVLTVQVEHTNDFDGNLDVLAKQVSDDIKTIVGIGAKVQVLAPETLPRATHKAKRVTDNRQGVWA
jgi:phenylacetate-CoA ligase